MSFSHKPTWRSVLDQLFTRLMKDPDSIQFNENDILRVIREHSLHRSYFREMHLLTFPMIFPRAGQYMIAVDSENMLYVRGIDEKNRTSEIAQVRSEVWDEYLEKMRKMHPHTTEVVRGLLLQLGQRSLARENNQRQKMYEYSGSRHSAPLQKEPFESAIDTFVELFRLHECVSELWLQPMVVSLHSKEDPDESESHNAITFRNRTDGVEYTMLRIGDSTYVGVSCHGRPPVIFSGTPNSEVSKYLENYSFSYTLAVAELEKILKENQNTPFEESSGLEQEDCRHDHDEIRRKAYYDVISDMLDHWRQCIDKLPVIPLSSFRVIHGALVCIKISKVTIANFSLFAPAIEEMYDTLLKKVSVRNGTEAKEVMRILGTLFPGCERDKQLTETLTRKYGTDDLDTIRSVLETLQDAGSDIMTRTKARPHVPTATNYLNAAEAILRMIDADGLAPKYRTDIDQLKSQMIRIIRSMQLGTPWHLTPVVDLVNRTCDNERKFELECKIHEYSRKFETKDNTRKFHKVKQEPAAPESSQQPEQASTAEEPEQLVTLEESLAKHNLERKSLLLDLFREFRLMHSRVGGHYLLQYMREKHIFTVEDMLKLTEEEASQLLGKSKYYAILKDTLRQRGVVWPSK